MNCERAQELILTDYLDGQLSAEQRKHVDGHLAQCEHCRSFVQAARQNAFEPFVHAERLQPSAAVWSNIRESIEAEGQKTSAFENLWEKIKSWTVVPNPAFVLVTLVTFLVVGGLTQVRTQREAKADTEYLESLSDMPGALSVNDGKGFGTTVEQYFL